MGQVSFKTGVEKSMNNRTKTNPIVSTVALILIVYTSAAAQTGVLLKPILKVGQEARFNVSGQVETQITPQGAGGLSGTVRRELTATLLIRAGVAAPAAWSKDAATPAGMTVSDSGATTGDLVYYEVTIEAITARIILDGAEKSLLSGDLAGQKIELALDPTGAVVKCMLPAEAGKIGLADVIFSLSAWAPPAPLTVGQTWGSSAADQIRGVFGYVSATTMSGISWGGRTAYKFSSLENDRAVVDGVIELTQKDASMLELPMGPTKVNATASGSGTTRIEYDTNAGRLASAVSETVLKGRLVNIPPTRQGAPMQPREGALVENAKFSVTLIP